MASVDRDTFNGLAKMTDVNAGGHSELDPFDGVFVFGMDARELKQYERFKDEAQTLRLINRGLEQELRVCRPEVYRADEMFCTGTMGELAAVVKVDGRTIGSGEHGPVTARLSELFAELTRNEGTVVV